MNKKFRAWDKVNKRMLSWDFFWNVFCADFFDSDYFIPMQFTGLLDKNGVEIYEGDIIKALYGLEGIVEFKYGSYVCKGLSIGQYYSKEIKVVGNIYNKEIKKNV